MSEKHQSTGKAANNSQKILVVNQKIVRWKYLKWYSVSDEKWFRL